MLWVKFSTRVALGRQPQWLWDSFEGVTYCHHLQEDEIQKAIFVGNYDSAVDTCLKVGRLADALLIANIGGSELFKKTMHRYMRRNPRPYMSVSCLITLA